MEKKFSVLVVDDEKNALKAIERELAEFQIELLSETNPKEAIKILKGNVIDVLITDQKMPGLSGLELVDFCQKQCPETVLILMSGYSDESVFINAINRGHVFYFIKKPWKKEELVRGLREAIRFKEQEKYKEEVVHSYLLDKTKWMEETLKYEEMTAKTTENIISAFQKIIEVKDKELSIHSKRVAALSEEFAVFLGMGEKECLNVRYAAEFHDLGKIVIKDRILYKEARLDEDEFEEMKRHPQVGAEVLREVTALEEIATIVEQHHEKADGSGYPKGLIDCEIRLEAKIISICDAFDALTTKRPYKDGMECDEAFKMIKDGRAGIYEESFLKNFERFLVERQTNACKILHA